MGDVLEFAGVMAVITASVLSIVGGIVWAVRSGRRGGRGHDNELAALRERVAQLEQALDVVAVEVERVGEAQRFTDRLLAPAAESARHADIR